MKGLLIFIIALVVSMSSYSQTKKQSACDSLIQEGYTQAFCDYNNNYAFKNIPFESNYSFFSSKIKLDKVSILPNTYTITDIDFREWAGLTFDYAVFKFSAKDKLESVLLKLKRENKDSTELENNFLETLNYLTHYFGHEKPSQNDYLNEKNNFHWCGNKVNIHFGQPHKNVIELMIERTNINDLDNL
ncbi:MAG: hypothetical protein ABI863_13050 [Ginsengibacter sp.]